MKNELWQLVKRTIGPRMQSCLVALPMRGRSLCRDSHSVSVFNCSNKHTFFEIFYLWTGSVSSREEERVSTWVDFLQDSLGFSLGSKILRMPVREVTTLPPWDVSDFLHKQWPTRSFLSRGSNNENDEQAHKYDKDLWGRRLSQNMVFLICFSQEIISCLRSGGFPLPVSEVWLGKFTLLALNCHVTPACTFRFYSLVFLFVRLTG